MATFIHPAITAHVFASIPTPKIAEVTITGPIRVKGSNQVSWNVDKDGRPFGQIYTFKAKGERHPFHVVTAKGDFHATAATYAAAERAIRGKM